MIFIRISELRSLTWSHVDFDRGLILVRGTKIYVGKRSSSRFTFKY